MAQSINLIPQQEVEKQAETKALNISTIISFVVLGIVVILSIYFLIVMGGLRSQIRELDVSINNLRGSIRSLSSIEIVARNLDKKYNVLSTIFENRVYYSKLMEELDARKPNGVEIVDLNLRENDKLNLSGHAETYILVADFTNTLLDDTFTEGNADLKNLFSEVQLNAVNLENRGGGVNFSLTITFKPESLLE